ncbi:tripartite tricarboxylate transporter substrate binding protein [Ramlibacter monticola]|uniref:Tripartite tricarboxylate transporter substrate binding protein n=1 Tax=Ramlibacter monticola TaxID=1926872 RepID=A0A937CUT2_9BURK|nr:tripartite tricarboxylate transporter substrate binding protein [Ramlibacter monticola]
MKFPSLLTKLALGLVVAGSAALAAAQDNWPTRPVKIIVPFSPGGGGDAVVRIISDKLGERLGQPVVIENRPGASGYIGAQAVAGAAPDGYTILMGFDGAMVAAPNLIKAPFDPVNDFVPITKLNDATLILAAHSSVPAKNLKELVDYSKTQPGGLGFGSSGTATTTHLAGELLALRSGAQLRHVPYKGGGQAVTDVAGGQIPLIYTVIPTIAGFVKDGRLRPIAVSSAKRSPVLPEVPTMIESGLAGFEVNSWYGLFAPAKTPKPIVDRIQREVAAVLQLPEIRERYLKGGFEPVANKPEEFAQQVRADLARWNKVVKDANIHVD